MLLHDPKTLGFLFESLVIHELKAYGQTFGAQVFHYRDYDDLEVDAIVERADGAWAAFEVKLGMAQLKEAEKNLKRFCSKLACKGAREPQALCVIIGFGGICHVRKSGIIVIPLDVLGP